MSGTNNFHIIRSAAIRTNATCTAKVGANDSFQEKFEFINATTHNMKPWKKWRSGYTCDYEHDISMAWTGGPIYSMVIMGANFDTVNWDSSDYTLVKNELGDYRILLDFDGVEYTPETWKIPAQRTESGYFEIGGIYMVVSHLQYLERNPSFPAVRKVIDLVKGNLNVRPNYGRRHRTFNWKRKGLTYLEMINLANFKQEAGVVNPIILYEKRSPGAVYLARFVDNSRHVESGYRFEDEISIEEIT